MNHFERNQDPKEQIGIGLSDESIRITDIGFDIKLSYHFENDNGSPTFVNWNIRLERKPRIPISAIAEILSSDMVTFKQLRKFFSINESLSKDDSGQHKISWRLLRKASKNCENSGKTTSVYFFGDTHKSWNSREHILEDFFQIEIYPIFNSTVEELEKLEKSSERRVPLSAHYAGRDKNEIKNIIIDAGKFYRFNPVIKKLKFK